jgi:hypothetical protein
LTDTFLADATALLERTPRVVRSLLDGLPDTWLDTPDAPDGWTPRDVVGHFISAELDDWIPRAELIVEQGTDRPFEPFDRFAHVGRDKDVPQLRGDGLARLRELVRGEHDLDLVGRHPELGRGVDAPVAGHLGGPRPRPRRPDLRGPRRQLRRGSRPVEAYLGILLRRDAT